MVYYFVGNDYDPNLNKVVLLFYNTETDSIFRFIDNTNFRPYCITDLAPDDLYKRCLSQAKLSIVNRLRAKTNEFSLELLPTEPIKKFNTINNETRQYYKIIGRTPLDIAGGRKNNAHNINISQYLKMEEEFNDDEDDEEEEEPEDEDDESYSEYNDAKESPKDLSGYVKGKEEENTTQTRFVSNAWENSIQYKYCYVHDKQLIFGMPYKFVKRFVEVKEPDRCTCRNTVGVYTYVTKTDQYKSDSSPDFLLTEIRCSNPKCKRVIYENTYYDRTKYVTYGKIRREFDFKTLKKVVLVPEIESEEIDPNTVKEIMELFKKFELPEICAYAENQFPLFFYKIPNIRRQAVDI